MSRKAVIIKFSIESRNFGSHTERNRFFRELYGWKQVVIKQEKRYIYHREGLLDQFPCERIDKSMLLIRKEYVNKILKFLQYWENKVNWNIFDVLLDEEQEKMFGGIFDD